MAMKVTVLINSLRMAFYLLAFDVRHLCMGYGRMQSQALSLHAPPPRLLASSRGRSSFRKYWLLDSERLCVCVCIRRAALERNCKCLCVCLCVLCLYVSLYWWRNWRSEPPRGQRLLALYMGERKFHFPQHIAPKCTRFPISVFSFAIDSLHLHICVELLSFHLLHSYLSARLHYQPAGFSFKHASIMSIFHWKKKT